ncbi:Proteinase T-like [Oopsacas minuta]|uniref:Proteinase T-like n=1 Tax=Oopsacas minuta TaxID=111878 RepID=A0AAV7JKE5_9METZ|nr:Proteinase T-like [Oopsacas minuta]
MLNWLAVAILLQIASAQYNDYIIVFKDITSQSDMNDAMEAMYQMSCPLDSSGNVISCDNNLKQTYDLMKTVSGPMSQEAVDMASSLSNVEYVEMDQLVTRADAVVDLISPTQHTEADDIPECLLNECDGKQTLIHDVYGITAFSAASTEAGATDRYNLDMIDQGCYECNNGRYEPEATGEGVDIYILDTGIRFDHSEFGNRASYGGYDAVDDFQNQNQQGVDCHGHGTHCAGIAAGITSGVAKEANIYSVRVLDCNSFGGFSGIIRALDHVLQRHRDRLSLSTDDYKGSVVSMSLAGPVVQAANEAVCRLVAAGVVVVTASGNFRRDACNYSPGSAGCHINVGAHYYTERDTDTCIKDVYWFTSRTTSPGSNYGRCVHIMAPGQYVLSASYLDSNRHVTMSGTSMACPHVAGAAALILDRYPRLSPDRVRRMLEGDACPDIDERRMHPSLRGLNPNRRLRVLQGVPVEVTIPPTEPATPTQPPTTPVPQICDTICPFDTMKNVEIEDVVVVNEEVTNIPSLHFHMYFALHNRVFFNNYRHILNKVSIAWNENFDKVTYSLIFRKVTNTGYYKYIYGVDNTGVPYQDIDEEIAELEAQYPGRTYYAQTIIPVGNNRVFILATYKDDCNDNEFRQANYTGYPEEVLNPFTIDNLVGHKATFDISITPFEDQVYVHDTHNGFTSNCECYSYYNIPTEQLAGISETLGGDRQLVVTAIDSYKLGTRLYFTVTLCMPECYTASECVDEVTNNMVFSGLDKEGLRRILIGAGVLGMEPIAVAPYYMGDEAFYALSLIRVN